MKRTAPAPANHYADYDSRSPARNKRMKNLAILDLTLDDDDGDVELMKAHTSIKDRQQPVQTPKVGKRKEPAPILSHSRAIRPLPTSPPPSRGSGTVHVREEGIGLQDEGLFSVNDDPKEAITKLPYRYLREFLNPDTRNHLNSSSDPPEYTDDDGEVLEVSELLKPRPIPSLDLASEGIIMRARAAKSELPKAPTTVLPNTERLRRQQVRHIDTRETTSSHSKTMQSPSPALAGAHEEVGSAVLEPEEIREHLEELMEQDKMNLEISTQRLKLWQSLLDLLDRD